MIGPTLTERRSPWVVVTAADDPCLGTETAALENTAGLVLRLNGKDPLEPALLFRTFAREFDFPS